MNFVVCSFGKDLNNMALLNDVLVIDKDLSSCSILVFPTGCIPDGNNIVVVRCLVLLRRPVLTPIRLLSLLAKNGCFMSTGIASGYGIFLSLTELVIDCNICGTCGCMGGIVPLR